MKTLRFPLTAVCPVAAALLTLIAACWPAATARAQASGWQKEALEYGWQLNYEAALQTARDRRQPLMVVLRCVP
ncbi:MAG: hypothetical protein J5I93_09905 [Pirellulaceae bacterium]|nr:hypothetical protein [Pirellulaceae bacterium]